MKRPVTKQLSDRTPGSLEFEGPVLPWGRSKGFKRLSRLTALPNINDQPRIPCLPQPPWSANNTLLRSSSGRLWGYSAL